MQLAGRGDVQMAVLARQSWRNGSFDSGRVVSIAAIIKPPRRLRFTFEKSLIGLMSP